MKMLDYVQLAHVRMGENLERSSELVAQLVDIFQKGIQLPKAARAYITFLEQFYGPDSGYEEECSENKNL